MGLGIVGSSGQQLADLALGEGAYRALADRGSGRVARRILAEQPPPARLLKGRVQGPVDMQHTARVERARGFRFAPLALAGDAATLQQERVEAIEVSRRQLLKWNVPDMPDGVCEIAAIARQGCRRKFAPRRERGKPPVQVALDRVPLRITDAAAFDLLRHAVGVLARLALPGEVFCALARAAARTGLVPHGLPAHRPFARDVLAYRCHERAFPSVAGDGWSGRMPSRSVARAWGDGSQTMNCKRGSGSWVGVGRVRARSRPARLGRCRAVSWCRR